MKLVQTDRGFEWLMAGDAEIAVVRQSSAIDFENPTGLERPGSSYLWLGKAHLNRAEVSELVDHLTRWLATGSLSAT